MKNKIIEEIDKIKMEILELSKNIHSYPELAFKEYQAVKWITDLLRKHGFLIENSLGGMDTAFKGVIKGKEGGPRVAFLVEYDGLPGIGHGCGHNIISASGVGGAIGLSKLIKDLKGEIVVIGTPAEERGGGKIILIEKGAFDTIDYGLMFHPTTKSMIGREALACTKITVIFRGRSAHSAGPHMGINALQGLIGVFNGIDSLRSVLKDQSKINGIITHGGDACNIIPDYAKGEFMIRAKTRKYLEYIIKKIKDIVRGAEILTGAKGEVELDLVYNERITNMTMEETFKKNIAILGEKMEYPSPDEILGSSDIGNVSMKIPIIHPYLKIVEPIVNIHSKEFAKAAISERAHEVVLKGAKGLAMTAYDIFIDEKLREEIKKEFNEKVKN